MKTVPKQKRGESRQDYGTPRAFIEAVERRFGALWIDLAATAENAKCPRYITPEENSLVQPWNHIIDETRAWLNPPFAAIRPWAAKCAEFVQANRKGTIFFLTPAAVGSNWFADFVHRRAFVYALQGRLTFEGETQPYPKDCILSVFHAGMSGFDVWDWRKS